MSSADASGMFYITGENEYYIFRKGTYKAGRKGTISYDLFVDWTTK